MASNVASYQPGMKGRPTEQLETCPYDKCHVVRYRKLREHLDKCRRNYLKQCLSENKRVVKLTCAYNPRHQDHAFGPEGKYHQQRCPDADRLFSYRVNIQDLVDAEEYQLPEEVADVQLDKDDFQDMFGGLKIDHIFGDDHFGAAIPWEDVKFPKKGAARRAKEKEGEAAKEAEKRRREEEEMKKMSEEDRAEWEYWNGPGTRPTFDMVKHQEAMRDEIALKSDPLMTRRERTALEKKVAAKKDQARRETEELEEWQREWEEKKRKEREEEEEKRRQWEATRSVEVTVKRVSKMTLTRRGTLGEAEFVRKLKEEILENVRGLEKVDEEEEKEEN